MCNIEAIVASASDGALSLPDIEQPLDNDLAQMLIPELEQQVHQHRFNDPQCAVEIAKLVIKIGTLRQNPYEIGLGHMLHGDSLWQAGKTNIQIAWDELELAATKFIEANDEFSWARTRIGRLLMSYSLSCVDDALNDAQRAKTIFIDAERTDKLITLSVNMAYVHNYLGNYKTALDLLQDALGKAEAMGAEGNRYLGALSRTIGYSYWYLGDLEQSQRAYERAYETDKALGWKTGIAISLRSLAEINRTLGQYQKAYQLLETGHQYEVQTSDSAKPYAPHSHLRMAELHIDLNRFQTARDLIKQVIANFEKIDEKFYVAYATIRLAEAEIGLGNFELALDSLRRAENIYQNINALPWVAMIQVYKASVALRTKALDEIDQSLQLATTYFSESKREIDLARAQLFQAQVLLQKQDFSKALDYAQSVKQVAQREKIPTLLYGADFVIGQIMEAQADDSVAIEAYQSALETLGFVLRHLTISLRSNWLVGKNAVSQALIKLLLSRHEFEPAFKAVEQIKSHIVLSELNQDNTHFQKSETDHVRDLKKQLQKVRQEHQLVYRLLHPSPSQGLIDAELTSEQRTSLQQENQARENKIGQLSEKISVLQDNDRLAPRIPNLAHIQSHLAHDTLLVEYYSDADNLWAFLIDQNTVEAIPLSSKLSMLTRLIRRLQQKLEFAIDVADESQQMADLETVIQKILHNIYDILLQPLAELMGLNAHTQKYSQITFVPFGILHYLPFALLFDGEQYLVEKTEIVILPSASLISQQAPHYEDFSACVIGHDWDGFLPASLQESEYIHEICSGDIFINEQAKCAVLERDPCKILHISCHGEYRISHPQFSFLQLDDGQVFTQDLLQHDLSYELVVLSACETGRATVTAGDELIGLGRGFIYGGAGALLSSLWRIDSDASLHFMKKFYSALLDGQSKATALTLAQRHFLEDPTLSHPVYWGAFQLIGDPAPIV